MLTAHCQFLLFSSVLLAFFLCPTRTARFHPRPYHQRYRRHLPMAVRRHRHTGCRLLVCAPICRTTGTTSYRPATQGQRARFKNHHRLPQRRSAPITGSDKGRRHAGKLQLHLQQGVSCQMLQKDGTRGKNPASLHQK